MIPGKFVLAEGQDLASDLGHNFAFVVRAAVFQNMLNNIVSILILETDRVTDASESGVRA